MKKHIILDLDNTLICAEVLAEFPFDAKGITEKALSFMIHDMDGFYIVFERPYLQEFLDYLFENFNVSVFTAASQSYGIFVVENIILVKPGRKLEQIFFKYHCDISYKLYDSAKDLRMLWETFQLDHLYQKDSVLIIDDNDEVYEAQPNLCIPIKAFNFLDENSENDSVLKDVIIPKLEEFKGAAVG